MIGLLRNFAYWLACKLLEADAYLWRVEQRHECRKILRRKRL